MKNCNNVSRFCESKRLINRWLCDFEEQNLTREEQIVFLQQAGLVAERKELRRDLSNIGLTTLRPYLCRFLILDDFGIHFKAGTTWNDVRRLYDFDSELRSLIFQGIQMFDVAFKEQIFYQLGNKYGPYWQYKRCLFKEPRCKKLHDSQIAFIDVHNDIQQMINRYQKQGKHECTFRSCHSFFNFSHYSRVYSHLRDKEDQQCISWHFYLPLHVFCSWVHALAKVRNLCAHGKHLWNRIFDVVPDELTFSTKHFWINNSAAVERDKVYYILCILNFLLQTVDPQFGFSRRVYHLMQTYESVLLLPEMGFLENWENEKLWQMTK